MRATCRLGFAIATTLLPLVAQRGADEAPRQPTFARVVDAAGAPLAGAVVTFAGCLPHVGPEVGPHDVLQVASDDRGRARAKLRVDLCYVAFAAAEVDGRQLLAEVVGYFAAGALLELPCRASERPRRVQVLGAEAWADAGPVRLFATTPRPGIEQELELVDGAVEVPPVPRLYLEVRTGDGQPLWQSLVSTATVTIPPPQRLPVRVVDENGAPLPGATLVQRVGRRMSWGVDAFSGAWDHLQRRLGVTGDDGTAIVTICSPGDLLRDHAVRDVLVFASAPGRPAVVGGRFHDDFYVDDRKVSSPPDSVLPFRLPRVEPLVGWVGTVPPGTVAHLAAVCKLFSSANSYYHDQRSFEVPVGPDGRVVFDQLPAEVHSCHLTLLSAQGEIGGLPLMTGLPGRALPFPGPGADAAAARVPACDLSVHVLEPTGGPARGAVLVLVPGNIDGVLVRDVAMQVPLDSGGGANVRLVPGTWHVLVLTGEAWLAATFSLEAGPREEHLAMQPLSRMQVRLLGDQGEPVVGAEVVARGTSTRSTGDPMQTILQNLHHAMRSTWWRLRTDADGRATIPFVPVEGLTRRLRLDAGERRSAEFELEANEEPFPLRLQ